MPDAKIAPYGSWKSPITTDLIVKESIGLAQVQLDGDDVYWMEMRPSEGGRQAIVRLSGDGQRADVTPRDFNARTRVHEYGGGDYTVSDGTLYFSNFTDQQLYRQTGAGAPELISQDCGDDQVRYADVVVDRGRQRLICVREDHRAQDRECMNEIASIPCDGGKSTVLVSGGDFYATPRVSPDGSRLAWLTWNHANRPWDGSELWTAEFAADGSISRPRLVAGGLSESVFQPEWSPDGRLYFVSDRSGWWNIYREADGGSVECIWEMKAEFGAPLWIFGLSTFAFESK